MCWLLGYSRSGYYKSIEAAIAVECRELAVIKEVQSVRHYQPKIGVKKLYGLLKASGFDGLASIGRDKLFCILRKHGMLVKRKRKYARTTDSYHHFRKYKNVLKTKLLTSPNQAYVSDITYLRTMKGFVYLFLQTDAYSRKITGWHLSESLGIEGAISALKMTLAQCPNRKGVIHHSDRGIQYCCKTYTQLLSKHKMTISMTEENHCYENSMAERVNGILKTEFLLDETFRDKAMALEAVKQAIDSYNTRRPHWALNLQTPQQVHKAA